MRTIAGLGIFAAVLSATVVAAGIFSVTVVRAFVYAPQDEEAALGRTMTDASLPEGTDVYPVRLAIPAIGVDTFVRQVGVSESGRMAVPHSYSDVGWYRYGALPGEAGSAVIAGHVDNGIGLPAVFGRLGELSAGSMVEVEMSDGSRHAFVVERVETYADNAVPLQGLFHARDTSRLNLITCKGGWLGGKWLYAERVVAYARLAQ